MPTRNDLWETVSEHIGAVKPTVDRSRITPQASLTADLGLDSLDLVAISTRITRDFPECDIMPWLAEASRPGMDTLGTFVAHVERQITEAAARGTGSAGDALAASGTGVTGP